MLIIKIIRFVQAAFEWVHRLFVSERTLPGVAQSLRDMPYGDDPKHRLDIVTGPGYGRLPIVVYIHGGGWVTGDKQDFEWPVRTIAAAGYAVFNVNYRWAPEASFADQLRDLTRALGWVRDNARSFGGDPARLFLAGDSAGAHLACWLTVALGGGPILGRVGIENPLEHGSLRGALLFYGIYDIGSVWGLGALIRTLVRAFIGGEPSANPELVETASPLRYLTPETPALFICAGEKDFLYRQSVELIEAAKRVDAPHTALLLPRREFPDAGHSFINFGGRAAAKEAMERAVEFLRHRSDG